ncbi:MAG: DPP IV N-terminal domain-containing protein [Acidobacteriota bacterium]
MWELNNYGNYGLGITSDGKTLVADLWDSSSQLWAVDATGNWKNAEQLTSGISDGAHGLATLADGKVVYSTRTGEDFDLWIVSAENGKREGLPLTSDSFLESDICVTQDNRFLVFASDRAGGQHLFRMEMDGSNITQLTSGSGIETSPDCSADSKSVVYASTKDSQTVIWKISIDGTGPAKITDFECVAPSFSPDDKSVACIRPIDQVGRTATITVFPAQGGQPSKSFDVVPFSWNYNAPRWTPDGKALIFAKTRQKAR